MLANYDKLCEEASVIVRGYFPVVGEQIRHIQKRRLGHWYKIVTFENKRVMESTYWFPRTGFGSGPKILMATNSRYAFLGDS